MTITIYFVGGTNIELRSCDQQVYDNLLKWLNNTKDRTPFVIGHSEGRYPGKIIPKDNLLFIDVK